MPLAFTVRYSSHTSVNESSFFALLSQPGLKLKYVLVEDALKQTDDVVAILQNKPFLYCLAAKGLKT